MGKLLHFEFRKLFRQKSFYICNVLLLAFVFLSAAISKLVAENSEQITEPLPTAIGILRSALQGAPVGDEKGGVCVENVQFQSRCGLSLL